MSSPTSGSRSIRPSCKAFRRLGPIVADLPAALEEAEEEAEAAGENYLFHVALKPLDNTWALVHEVEK